MRPLVWVVALACVAASGAGCTGDRPAPDDPVPGDPARGTVTAAAGGSVTDGRVTVSVPPGAVSAQTATLRVVDHVPGHRARSVPEAAGLGGIDVAYGVRVSVDGAQLTGPARVTFAVPPGWSATRYPVVLWESDQGWEVLPVRGYEAGQPSVTVRTGHFSTGYLASLDLGGWVSQHALQTRADPPTCAEAAPDWAEVSFAGNNEAVLGCGGTTRDGDRVRAEAKVVTNRGYPVEIAVPDGIAYAWVQGQGDVVRALVRAVLGGQDRVLLLPGQQMTVGFEQPARGRVVRVPVEVSVPALALGVASWSFSQVFDDDTGLLGLVAAATVLAECGGWTRIPLDATGGVDGVGSALEMIAQNLLRCASALAADPAKARVIGAAIIDHAAQEHGRLAQRLVAMGPEVVGRSVFVVAAAIELANTAARVRDLAEDLYVAAVGGGLHFTVSLHRRPADSAAALRFFRDTRTACERHAVRVGNSPVPGWLFAEADLVGPVRPGVWEVVDGAGNRLLVDLDRQVVYSTGGPEQVLPVEYSFGCPEDLYLGTAWD